MRRNIAGQFVGAQLNSKTDGSAVTTGTTTVYVTGDAGTQAAGSVGSGACTHEGNGYWTYAPAQAETNYTQVAFTFVNTSAVNATVQIYPTSYDANGRYDVGAVGGTAQTAGDIIGDTNDIQTRLPAALVSGRMDVSVGAMAANVVTAASIAAGALDGKGNWNIGKTGYSLTAGTGLGNQTADITGTISTVTTLTNLPTIPANWLTAAGIATGAFTSTKFAAGAIDAAALATDAVDEIRDGVWAKVQTELTGDPGATPTVLQSLALPYMAIRNKRDTDSGLGTDEIHNSAGSVILTAAISDAAGVFSKAKYA